MITSYALLRRDEELLQALDLRYVILDEAQHIKNPMSQTAQAAKKLEQRTTACADGHADREPPEGALEHLRLRVAGAARAAQDVRRARRAADRPWRHGEPRSGCRRRSSPSSCAALKLDVAADLPDEDRAGDASCGSPRSRQSSTSRSLGQVREEVMGEVEKKGVARRRFTSSPALTRLRQAACDPRLMKLPREFTTTTRQARGPARACRGSRRGGHRVLVFSQFVQMLQLIATALEADGVNYEYLDGSTKDRGEVDALPRRPERSRCS